MCQVMPHTSATFHQLHLFFINLKYTAIRVCFTIHTNHKTVRQRRYLEIITNPRHRTTLWYDITEVVEQIKQLLFAQRIRIFLLYTSYFTSQTPMHIFWRTFIQITLRILQGIFINPYLSRQFIAAKVFFRSPTSLFFSDFY